MSIYITTPTPNRTLRQVVARRGERICVRVDCIAHAVRWFTAKELETVNPAWDIAAIPLMELYEFTCAEPPPIQGCALPPVKVIELTPALAANVSHALGCTVKVVPSVSLWHESMASNAA